MIGARDEVDRSHITQSDRGIPVKATSLARAFRTQAVYVHVILTSPNAIGPSGPLNSCNASAVLLPQLTLRPNDQVEEHLPDKDRFGVEPLQQFLAFGDEGWMLSFLPNTAKHSPFVFSYRRAHAQQIEEGRRHVAKHVNHEIKINLYNRCIDSGCIASCLNARARPCRH